MSSLLIFEPRCQGHHMNYMHCFSGGAVDRGYIGLVSHLRPLSRAPAYLALQAECEDRLRTVTFAEDKSKSDASGVLDLTRLQIHYRRLFGECYRRLSRDERPDHVFIPYLGYCAYAVVLFAAPFRSAPRGGLMGSLLQGIKKKAILRLLDDKSLRAAFTFGETLIQHVQQSRAELTKRFRFLPEPTELHGSHFREPARRVRRITADAIVVLVYGVLDHTKGIDALLASTEDDRFPRGG